MQRKDFPNRRNKANQFNQKTKDMKYYRQKQADPSRCIYHPPFCLRSYGSSNLHLTSRCANTSAQQYRFCDIRMHHIFFIWSVNSLLGSCLPTNFKQLPLEEENDFPRITSLNDCVVLHCKFNDNAYEWWLHNWCGSPWWFEWKQFKKNFTRIVNPLFTLLKITVRHLK